MADLLETLRKLQALDGELYRLRNEQRLKPLVLEEAQQRLAEQQAKAQAGEARLKTAQVQQKEKEIELSTREANITKLQTQLFQVKTNKEYTALQQEIDRAKADVSLLEEEILALIDRIEQLKREAREAVAAVVQRQEALRTEEARITNELDVIGEELTALETQRTALTPSVDAASLAVYERILASRDGLALVPLIKDSCGGCHMVQPPQVINEAYLKTKLVICDSCSRILYVDDLAPTG